MKPPFAYYGGKTTLAERIVEVLPPHGHYIEPFAGSLAVLLAKPRVFCETVNDLDGDLMHFWRMLRDRPEDLARAAMLTPHSRAEHQAGYDREGLDDLERARRIWVVLSQGRTGTLRRTGWRYFRDPAGTGSCMPDYIAAYAERIPECARRLHGVSLECRPALEIIEEYGGVADALIYADPPYVGSARAENYKVEMADESSHRELAAALRAARAAVVLSGYASPLYEDLYGDWHRHEFQTWTGQGGTRGARTEVLWSNRPLGQQRDLFSVTDHESAEEAAS